MILTKDGESVYFSQIPNKKELESKTIRQLLLICQYKKRQSNPFKKALIEYLLKCKEL